LGGLWRLLESFAINIGCIINMFSVIIPTFNRRQYIGKAIDSVLSQSEGDVEVIVVDDGSSDGTVEWLFEKYCNQPVRVLKNSRRKGPAGARNCGILAATGDFIALLDSDDCFLPNHLTEVRQVFERYPGIDVVFGRAVYEQNGVAVDYMGPNFEKKLRMAPKTKVDENVLVLSDDFFTHLLEYGCYFNLSTVVIKINAARELMNEELRIAEDYEYWVRLSHKYRFACLNRPQISYLLHDNNISFEDAGSAADNSPSLLMAYKIILNYPALKKNQINIIRRHMADELFSWGYRCRKKKRFREALSLHLQSLKKGRRLENIVALLKIALIGVFPSLESNES